MPTERTARIAAMRGSLHFMKSFWGLGKQRLHIATDCHVMEASCHKLVFPLPRACFAGSRCEESGAKQLWQVSFCRQKGVSRVRLGFLPFRNGNSNLFAVTSGSTAR